MAQQPATDSQHQVDQTEPPADAEQQEQDEEREHKLDEAIEMTFPASDPISI